MKLIKLFACASLALLLGAGCTEDLEKNRPDKLSDHDFWKSEANLRTYNWEFYDLFTGYGTGTNGDFYFTSFSDDQVASTFQDFLVNAPARDPNWNWKYVRKANIMLERIDQVPMDEEAKKHWKGVARFFRALDYFKKVQTWGDVPWIGKSLDVSETEVIYKPRDPRALVMDNVLEDINYAVENLRVNDGTNVVNKDVALALKSRICLYEGTYRKYHTELGLAGADKFLLEAKDASEKLIAGKYKLGLDYQTLYNSMDLAGHTEVILYKRYVAGAITHSVIGYTNSSTQMNGLTKSAVEAYVATDGLPIGQSPLYQGDADISNTLANRDKRLSATISDFLAYNGNPKDGRTSSTGYRPSKFLQPAANQSAPQNDTDAPLFWLAEVYLNYAEACAELDQLGKYSISTADLDKSINKLRIRAGVAPLEVAGNGVMAKGVLINDTRRESDVPSLIWEIRRERRVELMMDGFRYQDLMRWKKGHYLDSGRNPDAFLGAKVGESKEVTRNAEGYIAPHAGRTRTFLDTKHYLAPIPTGQIALYPNGELKQNPGW